MADLVDVFQLVASIPNVPKKDRDNAIIRRLVAIEQREPGTQAAYARRLAIRALHHRTLAESIEKQFDGYSAIQPDDSQENAIRDFYHHIYYSAFYVARFALISNNTYDCSIHEAIDERLKELGIPKSALRRRAVELAGKLDGWRTDRDGADYIMSSHVVEGLAQLGTIRDRLFELRELFDGWSVQ